MSIGPSPHQLPGEQREQAQNMEHEDNFARSKTKHYIPYQTNASPELESHITERKCGEFHNIILTIKTTNPH